MPTTFKLLKSTDGTELYADATGNPQHPSIVFVHGIALCGAVFDQFFSNKQLLEKFYLVRSMSVYFEIAVSCCYRCGTTCVAMDEAGSLPPQKDTRQHYSQTILPRSFVHLA